MGVLASHVPSIEQLKPGLVEVIEESGGGSSKQFFCMCKYDYLWNSGTLAWPGKYSTLREDNKGVDFR